MSPSVTNLLMISFLSIGIALKEINEAKLRPIIDDIKCTLPHQLPIRTIYIQSKYEDDRRSY